MGRNSGGNNGGGGGEPELDKDSSYKGPIKNVRSLVTMKDPAMYKSTKEAISRFYSSTGAIERNIKIADMSASVYGVGRKGQIYLNGQYFDKADSKKALTKVFSDNQKSGWFTKNNKPINSVIHHEMAHSVWQSSRTEAKYVAAGKEISKMRKEWLKDTKKKGYGKYSRTNIDEFWAEVTMKAVSGSSDKYTRRAKAIIKKYKL